MSFGSRLKERREQLGITQVQLADMLGVTKGAIGNYETDLNSPKATILYKVFEVLQCDANYLFQDEMNELSTEKEKSLIEYEPLIKKYSFLDSHGQRIVNTVLDIEYERCSENERRITEFRQYENIAARGGSKHLEKDELNTLMEIFNDLSKK